MQSAEWENNLLFSNIWLLEQLHLVPTVCMSVMFHSLLACIQFCKPQQATLACYMLWCCLLGHTNIHFYNCWGNNNWFYRQGAVHLWCQQFFGRRGSIISYSQFFWNVNIKMFIRVDGTYVTRNCNIDYLPPLHYINLYNNLGCIHECMTTPISKTTSFIYDNMTSHRGG